MFGIPLPNLSRTAIGSGIDDPANPLATNP
jgi:hypothetical protein